MGTKNSNDACSLIKLLKIERSFTKLRVSEEKPIFVKRIIYVKAKLKVN